MDKEQYIFLSKLRIERAEELLQEAEYFLIQNSYKSANNRAYYVMEKSINALLILKGIETKTHNGCLKQFNMHFARTGEGGFDLADYAILLKAEQIRSSSDYDDFYIANKDECAEQVANARYIYNKACTALAANLENNTI